MSTTVRGPLYSALGPTEVRLLSLHSGREDEPIQCSLRHAELRINQSLVRENLALHKLESTLSKIKKRLKPSRQPKFEALSYCWGPAESYKSIEINGHLVPVRRNLWWTLQHLRHGVYGMRRTLWIDALCINQNDVNERSAQVSIMGSIYSTASRVLVWIGEESEESQAAFDCMRWFLQIRGSGQYSASWWRDYERGEKWSSLFNFQDLENFHFLCQKPYWERLWIIQELCLASRLRIHCGSDSVGWDDFTFWKEALSRYSAHLEREYRHQKRENDWQELNVRPENLNRLLAVRNLGGGTLQDLVQSSRLFQCWDPRDRIFGITALVRFDNVDKVDYGIPDGWRLPEVDYTKTSVQLYFDVMSWCLRNGIEGGPMSIDNVQKSPEYPVDEIPGPYEGFPENKSWYNRSDLLDLSHNLQEALEYPFENRNHVLPLVSAYGSIEQRFEARLLCQACVRYVSPIIKAHVSTRTDVIRWTTEDDLNLRTWESEDYDGMPTITKRNLSNVLESFEPVNMRGETSGAFMQSPSEHEVQRSFRTPQLFRICTGVMEMYTFIFLGPGSVKEGDFISRDYSIILRCSENYPRFNEGFEVIGRAFPIPRFFNYPPYTIRPRVYADIRFFYDGKYLHI
ncbi:Heterokaryon incompatibility protein (HET) domain containing protein [Hyaloscypha variabilis]